MIDEGMLAAIGSALSGAAGAGGALARLAALVRGALSRTPGGPTVLDEAQADPADVTARTALREHLRHAVKDERFRAELVAAWGEVHRESGRVVNSASGTTYGPVIQAGEIRGGVRFGAAGYPPAQRRAGWDE